MASLWVNVSHFAKEELIQEILVERSGVSLDRISMHGEDSTGLESDTIGDFTKS